MSQSNILRSWISRWVFKKNINALSDKNIFQNNTTHFNNNIYPILEDYINLENLNILDIGCGYGGAIKCLHKNNRITGVEVDSYRADFAKKHFYNYDNVEIINKNIFDTTLNENYYDLIIASDVIEHIDKTTELIQLVKKSLNKEGYCYLSFTPYNGLWGSHLELYLPLPLVHKLLPKKFIVRIIDLMGDYNEHISSEFVVNQFLHLNKINIRQFKKELNKFKILIEKEWIEKFLGNITKYSCLTKHG